MDENLPNAMQFFFPPIFTIRYRLNGNTIQQLHSPPQQVEVALTEYRQGKTQGVLLTDEEQVSTLILPANARLPEGFGRIVGVRGLTGPLRPEDLVGLASPVQWLRPIQSIQALHQDVSNPAYVNQVRSTWVHQLRYRQEQRDEVGTVVESGLRPPQIGALHAILAHWTVSSDPATVVMPTGTGKTETMLALLIANQCQKVLVIVPTDPLRDQIAGKFLSLGVLKPCAVVGKSAEFPVVGVLKHKPKNPAEVDELFSRCNIVVTTMSIAAGSERSAQKRMAELCSHLFIDEAHHIPAPTWRSFRKYFEAKPIVQFTATPFRRDGRHIDGTIIFNYPLLKAQAEGYFKPINFVPVFEFDLRRADAAIAKQALAQLKKDLAAGYNHILMARVKDIARTEDIYPLYRPYPEYYPVIIHSQLKASERRAVLQQIRTGATRIIICVDMLGEGFDLPELKIAAMHDIHKSLGVTLQFTGRFTRTHPGIGEATVIANTADAQVNDSLAELYGENADWNKLLRSKGNAAIEEQVRLSDFLQGFTGLPSDLPVQNLHPKMSTAIYRIGRAPWKPERFKAALGKDVEATHVINPKEKVLVVVTKKKEPIDWGDLKEITNLLYDLHVIYWDEKQGLLFINSTDTRGYHGKLAEAIGGEGTAIIKGDDVFRCFHGMKRVVLQNVGLNRAYSGPLRYVMFTGIDVNEGLSQAHRRNTFKSNLFGQGYEEGVKTSVGCSYKGRVWSRKITSVAGLCEWCSQVGQKILNEAINVDTVLEGVLKPVLITQRPKLMPIAIEWPASFLTEPEWIVHVLFKDEEIPLYETSIDLLEPSETGPLKFVIHAGDRRVEYDLQIFSEEDGKGFRYVPLSRTEIFFKVGGKKKTLADWADDDPPIIRFVDNSYIENNLHIGGGSETPVPFQKEGIAAWDWSSVNLKSESQGEDRRTDSIQYHVLRQLKQGGYDLLFDDDSAGEAADIIAIKILDEKLSIELYHCKFSHGDMPGARIKDLYEVCGQAQKSIHWKEDVRRLIHHMKRREARRVNYSKPTRFEIGDMNTLAQVEKMARFFRSEFKIFVVQPGLSRAQVKTDQLELLGATELYLKETYNIGLGVIVSA
jgi:superfamily II DNA or RNA helicase